MGIKRSPNEIEDLFSITHTNDFIIWTLVGAAAAPRRRRIYAMVSVGRVRLANLGSSGKSWPNFALERRRQTIAPLQCYSELFSHVKTHYCSPPPSSRRCRDGGNDYFGYTSPMFINSIPTMQGYFLKLYMSWG